MFDRKNKWAILVLILWCGINTWGQEITYKLNGHRHTYWDSNKTDLEELEVELEMHELASEFDRVRIQLLKETTTGQVQLGSVTYSKLQLRANGDVVKLYILEELANSYEQSDFGRLSKEKLTENYQDQLHLSIRVVGEEKIGQTSEWTCSSYCYSDCHQSCSGGFSTTTFDYGSPVVLSENNSFLIYQKQGWEKKQERERLVREELAKQKNIEDATERKSSIIRNTVFGVIGWGIAGVIIWDNHF